MTAVLYSKHRGGNRTVEYILWTVVPTRRSSRKRQYMGLQYVQRMYHILEVGEVKMKIGRAGRVLCCLGLDDLEGSRR